MWTLQISLNPKVYFIYLNISEVTIDVTLSKIEKRENKPDLFRKWWRFAILSRNKEARYSTIFNIVVRITVEAKPQCMLDVGCGRGEFSKYFSSIFGEIVLLDLRREVLMKTKSILPNSLYVCADAHYLPFKDNTFNQIHCFSLIEHLSQLEEFLSETFRVLKEKSLLIIQIPNPNSLVEAHTGIVFPSLLPHVVKHRILQNVRGLGYYVNLNLTRKNLLHQLSKLFTEIKTYEYNYPEEVVSNIIRPLFKIVKRLRILNIIPMSYIIVARKT